MISVYLVIMICGEAGEEMFGLARMPEALNGNTEGSPQGASDAGTQQSGRLCERRRALLPSGRNFPLDPTFSKVHLVFISVFLYNYISVQNRQSKHHGLCPTRYAVSGRAGGIAAFF